MWSELLLLHLIQDNVVDLLQWIEPRRLGGVLEPASLRKVPIHLRVLAQETERTTIKW